MIGIGFKVEIKKSKVITDSARALALPLTDVAQMLANRIDVQKTALNGAQILALAKLLADVAAGLLPPETARATITMAFPEADAAQVNAALGALKGFEPRAEEPKAPPVAA